MRVLAKGYSEGSTWLYQVLRPEHKLYRELFHQLHSLINKLHGLESEGYWDSQEKVRLDQFIKNVVDMQNAQKQNKLVKFHIRADDKLQLKPCLQFPQAGHPGWYRKGFERAGVPFRPGPVCHERGRCCP
eukprot:1142766-Pelagomonas_calceolata.AAC.9